MPRRNVQINGRTIRTPIFDPARLLVNQLGLRITANINLAIKTRLTNADRDTDISGTGCNCGQ